MRQVTYILGVQPSYDGLVIDPCIPAKWNGFKIARQFSGGASYEIEVVNPDHVQHGIKHIEVDGKLVECNRLPVFTDGKHSIRCTMG